MRVTIGSEVYELRTVGVTLVVNGETCASVVDHDQQEIRISDRVPMALRMDVAAQAVSEAWAHQVGKRPAVRFVGVVS
jgi:hypothetical protein